MSENSAIICEFNPLHKGHKYIIDCAKKSEFCTVIAIMSGNFTQRGQCAIFDKYVRAEAAVKCGVDLVLELPFPWCSAGAEFFAYGGVSIANSIGVQRLVFGSESGDLEYIKKAAEAMESNDYLNHIKKAGFNQGAAAAHDSIMRKFGLNLGPNDKLAKEYIRSANKLFLNSLKMEFEAKKRIRVGDIIHQSASDIREIIDNKGLLAADNLIEKNAMQVYKLKKEPDVYPDKLQELEYLYFSFFSDGMFDNIFEASGGLGNHLLKVAKSTVNYRNFYFNASTKKYTNSRIRRAALFSVMKITKEMLEKRPLCTVLLAANKRGRKYLSSIKNNSKIKIISKPSDTSDFSDIALEQYNIMARADALYALCFKKSIGVEDFMRRSPYICTE